MRFDILAQQLVRELRGKRSQVALSRRLLFSTNVVYTWESGKRAPTAALFFELAERVGVDVARGLGEFLGGSGGPVPGATCASPSDVAAFLTHLRDGTTVAEIARRMRTNRASVSRWLNGQAEPKLPEFLALVEATSLRLLDFLAIFVSPASLVEAAQPWQLLESQRDLAYRIPWSHAVLRCIEVEAYKALPRHEAGWLAKRLGITQEEEARCLEALLHSRLIAERGGRYEPLAVLTVDTRQRPAAGRTLKAHWAKVGSERLPLLEGNDEDLFSYNLFTVSEADWQKLRELHIAYFRELRRVISASTPGERVAIANLQLFRLDEPIPPRAPAPSAGAD